MNQPQRKQIRLKNYDYSSPGYYFVTICTYKKQCIFGKIIDGEMISKNHVGAGLSRPDVKSYPQIDLTTYGEVVKQHILELSSKYPSIEISKYVIMPNHVHMILILNPKTGRDNPAPTKNIGNVIGYYKYQTTKHINSINNNGISKIWQRNYYDHIIRNEQEYQQIWEYIDTNPLKWMDDCYYIK